MPLTPEQYRDTLDTASHNMGLIVRLSELIEIAQLSTCPEAAALVQKWSAIREGLVQGFLPLADSAVDHHVYLATRPK